MVWNPYYSTMSGLASAIFSPESASGTTFIQNFDLGNQQYYPVLPPAAAPDIKNNKDATTPLPYPSAIYNPAEWDDANIVEDLESAKTPNDPASTRKRRHEELSEMTKVAPKRQVPKRRWSSGAIMTKNINTDTSFIKVEEELDLLQGNERRPGSTVPSLPQRQLNQQNLNQSMLSNNRPTPPTRKRSFPYEHNSDSLQIDIYPPPAKKQHRSNSNTSFYSVSSSKSMDGGKELTSIREHDDEDGHDDEEMSGSENYLLQSIAPVAPVAPMAPIPLMDRMDTMASIVHTS